MLRRGSLLLSGFLALALLVRGAEAQEAPSGRADPRDASDPRQAADPRRSTDPREGSDPRQTDTDPRTEPPGPALYDALYAGGQEAKLKQALGENGWHVLDYIRRQCESWLSLSGRGTAATAADHEQLAAVEEKGRKLARFADEALLDSRFQTWVDTVFGWDREEQQLYLESQELIRQGLATAASAREASAALGALTPLEQALDRARRLGDLRTQSVALVAIGNLQAAVRDELPARATMQEAVRIGREVRDLDGVWGALSVLYESAVRTREWDLAEEALQEQYLVAQEAGDVGTAQRVLRQLVDLSAFREQNR